ncbi:MAG TPA: DUF1080 domain-containing protein [Opitutaceae bacterium]
MHLPRIGVALATLALAAQAAHAADWQPLFNGSNLDGWRTWLGKPPAALEIPGLARDAKGEYAAPLGWDRDPLGVFTVVAQEGRPAIRISGQVNGGLVLASPRGNYRLRLAYKWGAAPAGNRRRNSGLLYHGYTEPGAAGIWPSAHEMQMMEGNAGDYYAIGGASAEAYARKADAPDYVYDSSVPAPLLFAPKSLAGRRCQKSEVAESPAGQWTNFELVCYGDQSAQIVNGKTVLRLARSLRATDAGLVSLGEGTLLIQSEGAELFVRDVEILPLTEAPAELK